MQVIIHELVSKVRALDADSILAPTTLKKIIETVLQAVQEKKQYEERISGEHTLQNYQKHSQRHRR